MKAPNLYILKVCKRGVCWKASLANKTTLPTHLKLTECCVEIDRLQASRAQGMRLSGQMPRCDASSENSSGPGAMQHYSLPQVWPLKTMLCLECTRKIKADALRGAMLHNSSNATNWMLVTLLRETWKLTRCMNHGLLTLRLSKMTLFSRTYKHMIQFPRSLRGFQQLPSSDRSPETTPTLKFTRKSWRWLLAKGFRKWRSRIFPYLSQVSATLKELSITLKELSVTLKELVSRNQKILQSASR